MHYALKRLHRLVVINTTKGSIEMSNPTPDMRSIDQNDINAWAENVNAAVTALQTIIANGNLTAADESLMNTAIGTLDGVAGTVTPPVTPPAGQ
jgi:hypothetical protein